MAAKKTKTSMSKKTKTSDDTDKPRLRLSGEDGNAFMVLGLAHRAAKKAGWPDERWQAVRKDAMAGDYDHLLATITGHFDVT